MLEIWPDVPFNTKKTGATDQYRTGLVLNTVFNSVLLRTQWQN